jgi:hypothetical protein
MPTDPNLRIRGTVYWLRRRLPKALVPHGGRNLVVARCCECTLQSPPTGPQGRFDSAVRVWPPRLGMCSGVGHGRVGLLSGEIGVVLQNLFDGHPAVGQRRDAAPRQSLESPAHPRGRKCFVQPSLPHQAPRGVFAADRSSGHVDNTGPPRLPFDMNMDGAVQRLLVGRMLESPIQPSPLGRFQGLLPAV